MKSKSDNRKAVELPAARRPRKAPYCASSRRPIVRASESYRRAYDEGRCFTPAEVDYLVVREHRRELAMSEASTKA